MARSVAAREVEQSFVARCSAGLDAISLQDDLVDRLGRLVPADAIFCASVDPATLLFTSAVSREVPPEAAARFLANEFFEDDVNKFRALARQSFPVDWLDRVTGDRREASARYREIMAPLGLGDEMRAVLRSGGECWGFLCLHREDGPRGFTQAEARVLARLSRHAGEGLRRALLVDQAAAADEATGAPGETPGGTGETGPEAPGVLLVGEARRLIATTATGDRWLWELADPASGDRLPLAVDTVLAALEATRRGRADLVPRVRVRTRSGRWAVLHAADLTGGGPRGTADTAGAAPQVVVIVEPAKPAELAPMILAAYGLTRREAEVAQAALKGLPNRMVARALGISENTVEDHVKSVYAKTGVGNRGELMARVFADHHVRPPPARG